MIKILYLDHCPFWGGAERVMETHLKLLDKEQFLPLVAVSQENSEFGDRFKQAGAEVFTIPFAKLKTLNPFVLICFAKSVRAIIALIRQNNIDLIVTNTSRVYYTSVIAARMCGVPILAWVHDFFYIRHLFKMTMSFTSGVIWTSHAVRNFYNCSESLYSRVIYPENRFEEDLSEVILEDAQKLREVWGVSEDDVVIGFVGRLVQEKGIQVLVRALEFLRAGEEKSWALGTQGLSSKIPSELSPLEPDSGESPAGETKPVGFKLVIVGTGQGQLGGNEAEIKTLVKELGLEDRVIFVGFSENPAVFYKAFDIFAFPSIGPESYPTVVVEAMLAGLPVVGTSTGGTVEQVKDGETGFLVPPNDAKALAKALLQFYQPACRRDRETGFCQVMGKLGREKALKVNVGRGSTRKMENLFSLTVEKCL